MNENVMQRQMQVPTNERETSQPSLWGLNLEAH